MRRTIAQRLTAATNSMPTFYLTVDCDLGKLNAAREKSTPLQERTPRASRSTSSRSMTSSSRRWRLRCRKSEANVSWTEAAMLRHKHSDIGVAVHCRSV
jgi:pyruvate dehydrogenase E2 component (dihydrolipoamide acetyltransferase)